MCKRTGQQTHYQANVCYLARGLFCALILLSQAWGGPGALANQPVSFLTHSWHFHYLETMLSFRVLLLKYVRQTRDVQSQANHSRSLRHKRGLSHQILCEVGGFACGQWKLSFCDLCECQVLFLLTFQKILPSFWVVSSNVCTDEHFAEYLRRAL